MWQLPSHHLLSRHLSHHLLSRHLFHHLMLSSISSSYHHFNSSIASPHHFIYRIPSSFYHIIHSSIYLFTLSISSLEFIYLITSHLFINRITSHPFIYLTSAGANINAVDKLGIDWCSPHCSVACSDCMHPTGEEKCECFDQQRGT